MQRITTIVLLLIVSNFFGVAQRPEAGPQNVSLVELIASPQKFDGVLVNVIGYLDMSREGDLLYLHQTDSDNMLNSNAIWVHRTEEMGIDKTRLNHKYVTVVGVFRSGFKEQFGTPSCGIPNATRVESWSDPSNPVKRRLSTLPGVNPTDR